MPGYAEEYASLMSTSSVKKRGIALYENGATKSEYYNKASKLWTLKVQGSSLYTVQIHDTGKKILSASCSCPYDWHGICKHIVAALLYIENKEKKNIQKDTQTKSKKIYEKTKKRNGWLPFNLNEYKTITTGFITEHYTNFNEIVYLINRVYILSTEFEKNSITFNISFNRDDFEVKFFKKNNKIYIKSDETSNVASNKLTRSEAVVLYLISESPTPNMLALHFDNEKKIFERNILKKYGLPKDADYNDYFSSAIPQQNFNFSKA